MTEEVEQTTELAKQQILLQALNIAHQRKVGELRLIEQQILKQQGVIEWLMKKKEEAGEPQ